MTIPTQWIQIFGNFGNLDKEMMDPNIWQFRSGNEMMTHPFPHPFHRDANLYADPLLREARLHDAGADHLHTAMNGEVS